jgi:hypothetical protein
MRNEFTFDNTRLGVKTLRLLVPFPFLLLQGVVKNVHQSIWQGLLALTMPALHGRQPSLHLR